MPRDTYQACRVEVGPEASLSALSPRNRYWASATARTDRPTRAKLRPPPRDTSRFQRGKLASMSDVIRILSAIEQGDPSAAEQLLPLVYDELRKLAAHRLAQEKPGQT